MVGGARTVQVVEAMLHLHNHGVVHGDIKANNVMIDSTTSPLRVVLVDFGCAVLQGDGSGDMNADMEVRSFVRSFVRMRLRS